MRDDEAVLRIQLAYPAIAGLERIAAAASSLPGAATGEADG
jgi:hypothetical protein